MRPMALLAASLSTLLVTAAGAAGGDPLPTSRQGSATLQTFVTYRYVDPMVGMEAFRLLIPKGRRAEGSATWPPRPALPIQSHLRGWVTTAPPKDREVETRKHCERSRQRFGKEPRHTPIGPLR